MFAGWVGESMNKVKPNGFKNDFPCTPPTASPRVQRNTINMYLAFQMLYASGYLCLQYAVLNWPCCKMLRHEIAVTGKAGGWYG